jgi:hypothetical protein
MMDIVKMTVEQALEFTVNHTRGSTFSADSWNAKVAMLVMAKEIKALRHDLYSYMTIAHEYANEPQQLTKPADEVLIEALTLIKGLTGCSSAQQLEAMRDIYSISRNALNAYKPADDTITVSKAEWEAVSKDAKRWEIARTLGVAVVNDKGNITGAHFNEGADQRVDKTIQGESK